MNEHFIYGYIGDEEASPTALANFLLENSGSPVKIHVNSMGGDATVGVTMAMLMKQHGDVTALVEGIAASAASVAITGAKTVQMSKDSMQMIHLPSTWAMGTAKDINRSVVSLEKLQTILAEMYSNEKLSKESALKLMEEETWMDANEALSYGLCDEIVDVEFKAVAYAEKLGYRKVPARFTSQAGGHMAKPEQEEEKGFFATLKSLIPAGHAALEAKASELEASNKALTAKASELEAKALALEGEKKTLSAKVSELENALSAEKEKTKNISAESLAALRANVPIVPPGDGSGNPGGSQTVKILEDYNNITDPVERAKFFEANKAKILAAAAGRKEK